MSSLALAVMLVVGQAETPPVEISANPTVYQPVTITVTGPEASETGEVNPFRDYLFKVELWKPAFADRGKLIIAGYFAADGNAAESGATEGNRWRVRFRPMFHGSWGYKVLFHARAGADTTDPWKPISPNGVEGTFQVAEADPTAPGFYGSGPITHVPFPSRRLRTEELGSPGFDSRDSNINRSISGSYLRHSGELLPGEMFRRDLGRPFLKIGADSPENLLAYAEFDGTRAIGGPQPKRDGESSRKGLHAYEPHVRDWKEGDPTWQNGKGKGLIGSLNYLASQGVNSIYFLPMNVAGDGQDVWPWIAPDQRDRFDVSKLDQWGIVFDHAAKLGIALHVVLTETENENLFEALDGPGSGDVPFADTRKFYYWELIARFGHHPAIVWNLGEENGGDGKDGNEFAKGNTTEQRKAFATFVKFSDPYNHPVVVHTYPGQYDKVYEPLLGFEHPDRPLSGFGHLDGPSLQMGNPRQAHAETLKWLRKSKDAGRPWFVCIDEIGPADTGVVPDDAPNAAENHKLAREVLWGNLLAGGSGVEWYFGYKYAHNDLNCEDFRRRESVWKFSKAAIDFFHEHLPFEQMESADELVKRDGAFCMAKAGEVYAVYLPDGSKPVQMTLPEGEFSVRWFDPVGGGELASGNVKDVEGGDDVSLGEPPMKREQDWVVLVRREGARESRE